MKHRREIDGLRALAVVPVIFFHSGFRMFSGGFVGVDVFFVISGFLITSIIVGELEAGRFSLLRFYERRARRILPALFFVMLVSVPLALMFLSRNDWRAFSDSLVAVSLFVSNVFFFRDGNYFETAGELKPLLHTWSLAVEEQYYLLFPLFLILTWRLGKRWIVVLLALAALLSLGVAQWGSTHAPIPTFFLLPTRAWELAIGALAAFFALHRTGRAASAKVNQLASSFGLLLILGSVFVFDRRTPFPSLYALVPTVGTALILLYGDADTVVGRLLGMRLLVGVGLISYSAYLWHQPLLAFARNHRDGIGTPTILVLIAASLILALFSWWFVERPFRNRQSVSRGVVFGFAGAGSLLFIAVGLSTAHAFESSDNERELAAILAKHPAVYATNMDERKFVKYRISDEDVTPDVLVLGSSRAMQIGERNLKRPVLNLSVSGSSVEDDVAIADMALKKFQPKMVLISADPWLFNSASGQDRWKSLEAEYHQALSALMDSDGESRPGPSSLASAGSVASGVSSLMESLSRALNATKLYADDDAPCMKDKIRRDGSRVYHLGYAQRTETEIERTLAESWHYAMHTYTFSQDLYDVFDRFLRHTRAAGNREVVLVLSPYHPKLYELMKNGKEPYVGIEEQFQQLAKQTGVKIVGSYDPAVVGCTNSEFYDGMHPKPSCMGKVLSELGRP